MRVDFTFNVWTVVVTLIGWLVAGGVVAWRLGAFAEAFRALKESFDEHEVKDDKRFDGLTCQVHQVQIEQARLSGKTTR